MNKIFSVIVLLSLLILTQCFFSEPDFPQNENWLSKIKPDSTDFQKLIEVTYESPTDYIKIHNFLVTPDESYFIINSGFNGIWRIDIDGNNPTKISDTLLVRKTELAFSDDSNWITFASQGDIFRVNVDGSSLIQLTDTPDDYEDHPDFYFDDEKIVYTKINALDDSTQSQSICSMDNDGSNQIELITTISREDQVYTYPMKLPESDLILYNYWGDNQGIYSYDMNNYQILCIFEGTIKNNRISTTEDGSKIIAVDRYDIFVIDHFGSKFFEVTESTYLYYTNGFLSPDGSYIIVTSYDNLLMYNMLENNLEHFQKGFLPCCFDDNIYFIWTNGY